jgi:geranylgeranyl diphosphate synthase type II
LTARAEVAIRARRSGDPLVARTRVFDAYLARTLSAHAATGGRLEQAIRWAALSPGKRLRPLLALGACEAAGGRWREALPAAAALECVHAFSLVHDDLPAMDDDDYRRGRLTTHKKFGEALGVLAGDALLAFAFEELTRLPAARKQPARVLLAVRLLAEASGAHQLIQGQALDIAAEGRRVTRDAVAEIHLRKTGALIACSLALGALAGGADARQVGDFHDLGLDLGLAFQIHDDLLNAGSSLAKLGKRAGTDAARGKATWPKAVGEAKAVEDVGRLYVAVLGRLEAYGPRARALRALVTRTAERSS